MIACVVSVSDGGFDAGELALDLRRFSSEDDQFPRWQVEA